MAFSPLLFVSIIMTVISVIMIFLGLSYTVLDLLDAPGFKGVKYVGMALAILGIFLAVVTFYIIR
ncbi:hypothetical protein [Sulfuracidifex tepidarius]|uniref:Uncharacterized protein n=1 Tax=Sulfuracidifex tepidarius TaxID=1294262 RepID=A0A510DZ09_9CREN|nr:hypothetical protein [Sulfuracidifex tepidarius]BBG25451.1 hypothetical protein IC006_2787 [Sulfuracidifex tepidarius]BBG28245.1 hypothetical protein IC007_2801 [Sulfuracidifex tepidarius]